MDNLLVAKTLEIISETFNSITDYSNALRYGLKAN